MAATTCSHIRAPNVVEKSTGLSEQRLIKCCADCGCTCSEMLHCLHDGCDYVGCAGCCHGHFRMHAEEYPGHSVGARKDRMPVCVACADTTTIMQLPESISGLSNLMNTCYLNASVQALVHIPAFASFFLDCVGHVNATKLASLCRKMSSLVKSMYTADDVTPKAFVNHVRTTSRQFSSYGQQDSQEFIRYLIDTMHEELKASVPSANKEYPTALSKIFRGELESNITCSTCGRSSVTREPFFDLLVELPDVATIAHLRGGDVVGTGPEVSLLDCVRAFVASEQLLGANKYSCEHCKSLQNATKSMKISKLPEVLCISLKRFRHDGMYSSKISRPCSFPARNFDLRSCLNEGSVESNTEYELVSFVSHMGSVGGGHYIAFAKHPLTQRWHLYDDTWVEELSEDQVLSEQAYVLFYRKLRRAAPEDEVAVAESLAREAPRDVLLSRAWLSQMWTLSRSGPIDCSDFACAHGGLLPVRGVPLDDMAVAVSLDSYLLLKGMNGALGPIVFSHVGPCAVCTAAVRDLERRREFEREKFKDLRSNSEEKGHFYIAMDWLKQWLNFVESVSLPPPGSIDNKSLLDDKGAVVADSNKRAIVIPEMIWRFLIETYGGGPVVPYEPRQSGEQSDSSDE